MSGENTIIIACTTTKWMAAIASWMSCIDVASKQHGSIQ
jgi:hypothetical protein